MGISTDAEEAFDTIQCAFGTEGQESQGLDGTTLPAIKAKGKHALLNGENHGALPCKPTLIFSGLPSFPTSHRSVR